MESIKYISSKVKFNSKYIGKKINKVYIRSEKQKQTDNYDV